MMMRFLIVLLLLIEGALAGNSEGPLLFYNNSTIGEFRIKDYSGPLDPASELDFRSGKVKTLDHKFYNDSYWHSQFQLSLFELKKDLFEDFMPGLYCPVQDVGRHSSYMRYLFRLVTLSYLYESININNKDILRLGEKSSRCSINWPNALNSCSAKSLDMKTFLKRAKFVLGKENYRVPHNHSFSSYRKEWLSSVNKVISDKSWSYSSPYMSNRYLQSCSESGSCDFLTVSEGVRVLSQQCEQDFHLFLKVCSENDQLYGLNSTPMAYQLILQSNVMSILNDSGHGEDCLRQYVNVMERKEISYPNLGGMFDGVFMHLKRKLPTRFIQGRLFLPGAMKEFDLKGLTDFLYEKKETKTKIVKVSKPEPIATLKAVYTPQPKFEVSTRVTPIPTPIATQKPVVVLSAFESAVKAFKKVQNSSKPIVDLDMEKFKNDFIFTNSMIKKFRNKAAFYQKRKSLREMKLYENFGSKSEPFRLIFLKYLIDLKEHQGLYNVLAEMGDKFYVINDIEDKSEAVYIKLYNEGLAWKISLVKYVPPPPPPKKVIKSKKSPHAKKSKK